MWAAAASCPKLWPNFLPELDALPRYVTHRTLQLLFKTVGNAELTKRLQPVNRKTVLALLKGSDEQKSTKTETFVLCGLEEVPRWFNF
jgi:hypothetical protein